MFYVRKINKGKWSKIKSIDDVTDDFIKSELRLEDNTLSVWKLNEDYNDKELNSIFLALGSNMEHLGTINLVLIKDDSIKKLKKDDIPGETPAVDINNMHCNVVIPDRASLNIFIQGVIDAFKSNNVIPKTKTQMEVILKVGLRENRIVKEKIPISLLKKLEK